MFSILAVLPGATTPQTGTCTDTFTLSESQGSFNGRLYPDASTVAECISSCLAVSAI